MVAIVNAAVDDAVENLVSILSTSLGHLEYSLGREGAFSIDEENLPLQSAFCGGKLGLNTQFHKDLRFAISEFPNEDCYGLCFKATTQQRVTVVGSEYEMKHMLSSLP